MAIVQIPLNKEFMPFGNVLPYEIQKKILDERIKILEKERKEMIMSLTDEEIMLEVKKRYKTKKKKNLEFGVMFKTRDNYIQIQCHDIIDIVEWIENQFEFHYGTQDEDDADVDADDNDDDDDNSSGIGDDDMDDDNEDDIDDDIDVDVDDDVDDDIESDSESEGEDSHGELFSTTVFGPDPAYVNLRDLAYNAWRNFDDITKSLIAADIFENIGKPDKLILSNRVGEYTDEEIKGVNCIQYIMKCFRSERYTIENEQLKIHENIVAN